MYKELLPIERWIDHVKTITPQNQSEIILKDFIELIAKTAHKYAKVEDEIFSDLVAEGVRILLETYNQDYGGDFTLNFYVALNQKIGEKFSNSDSLVYSPRFIRLSVNYVRRMAKILEGQGFTFVEAENFIRDKNYQNENINFMEEKRKLFKRAKEISRSYEELVDDCLTILSYHGTEDTFQSIETDNKEEFSPEERVSINQMRDKVIKRFGQKRYEAWALASQGYSFEEIQLLVLEKYKINVKTVTLSSWKVRIDAFLNKFSRIARDN